MKITLITKPDRKQIVFHPETKFEEDVVKMFEQGVKEAKIYLGSYYNCQGGWTREGMDKDSLIIVFDEIQNKADN